MQTEAQLKKVGIVPVITMDKVEHALPLAQALIKGGLPAAEITFRSEAAVGAINAIAKEAPGLFICAGTVLSPEMAKAAVDAGASAIISPGTHIDTIRWCQNHDVPVIPGCATPTEVETCMREGLNLLKFFPAQAMGGVAVLKAFMGPYSAIRFMPTGGVNPGNVKEYLSQKNVVACGGTWIVPMDLLSCGDFDAIAALARDAATMRDELYGQDD